MEATDVNTRWQADMAQYFELPGERPTRVRAPRGGLPPCLSTPRSTSARRAAASWSGGLRDGRVELEEVHRFPNRPVRLPDGLHWNLLHLFTEALAGLRTAGAVQGVGV